MLIWTIVIFSTSHILGWLHSTPLSHELLHRASPPCGACGLWTRVQNKHTVHINVIAYWHGDVNTKQLIFVKIVIGRPVPIIHSIQPVKDDDEDDDDFIEFRQMPYYQLRLDSLTYVLGCLRDFFSCCCCCCCCRSHWSLIHHHFVGAHPLFAFSSSSFSHSAHEWGHKTKFQIPFFAGPDQFLLIYIKAFWCRRSLNAEWNNLSYWRMKRNGTNCNF